MTANLDVREARAVNAPAILRKPRRDSVVIVPTYNESDNLVAIVQRILALDGFDVLVVDDHSPDGTEDAAGRLVKRHPRRMAMLRGLRKRGLGKAYLQGFDYALVAGYEHVFQMDADLSHDPDDLPRMRSALDDADVALGSRYVPGGEAERWPMWRRIVSRGGSVYSARVLGLPFCDLTSGFKGFRRRVLETLDSSSIRSRGHAFQIEVTYRCARLGFQIVEVPIVFRDRLVGQSKIDGRIIAEALTAVWRLRLNGSLRETIP
jgi:dolichol-phosphate mannosyltransferase